MKISTKGRYALRLMVDIAQHTQEGPVSLRDAARRQQLSDKYLEGDLAPVECATDDGYCEHSCDCVTVELWQDIHKAVSAVVDGTTLADLVERQNARQSRSEPTACP